MTDTTEEAQREGGTEIHNCNFREKIVGKPETTQDETSSQKTKIKTQEKILTPEK